MDLTLSETFNSVSKPSSIFQSVDFYASFNWEGRCRDTAIVRFLLGKQWRFIRLVEFRERGFCFLGHLISRDEMIIPHKIRVRSRAGTLPVTSFHWLGKSGILI